MRRSMFWLVPAMLLILITADAVMAKEIALVTDVRGTVTATLDNNRSWHPVVGESLPVGAKIAVGPDGELKLIHLGENKEFTLGANAQATLQEDSLADKQGCDAGQDLEGLPTGISLEAASKNQMGAIDPQRMDTPASPPDESPPAKSEESNTPDNFDKTIAPPPPPSVAPAPAPAAPPPPGKPQAQIPSPQSPDEEQNPAYRANAESNGGPGGSTKGPDVSLAIPDLQSQPVSPARGGGSVGSPCGWHCRHASWMATPSPGSSGG